MSKLRVCIVGTGFISHFHVKGLMLLKDVELEGIVDLNPESAKKFSNQYGIKEIYSDYDSFINGTQADLVILSIPNYLHYDYTMKALNSGKHVFVEKPMSFTVNEAQKMDNLSKEKGLSLMVGHMWRFDREVRYLAEQVRSGKLGKVFRTTGYGIHENWGPSGWFTQKKLAGGGALADMGIHAIDTARALLGDPLPVKVYAKIGTFMKDYDVDDTGVLMVDWDNGTTSLIETGWWQPHMDGPESGTKLYGTEGYGSLYPTGIKNFNIGTTVETIPRFPERNGHCDQHMYNLQMEEFISAINENRQPVPGASEGIINMKIVEAAYKSSDVGQAIII